MQNSKAIGLTLFIFLVIGSISTVLGTFLAVIIGIGMLAYIYEKDD